ncbi:DUF6455 family protein [Rhizobium sp. SSA_523]|uniref:DUF6455 family protein n=1 Tax=Rhizobium sp. SSA_523 TaxID=2952477 RepID=UPI00209101BF|nr:DUF6455 family protein [Rhizobium sp. SSA_523]MCO5730667.1 DUF6455 family protein [Rhizobium sp. SSA_523]WKC24504.1 DUF6455 family protein [Rhizobium sp. SSA_523]
MTMNDATSHLAQRVGKQLVDWYSDLRTRHADEDALMQLDPDGRRQLAADCNVNFETLLAVVRAGAHGADEMVEMLKALHIDPADLEAHLPALFRDMQVTCATCEDKSRCRHELKDGTAPVHFADYCANAPALNVMRAEPPLLRD